MTLTVFFLCNVFDTEGIAVSICVFLSLQSFYTYLHDWNSWDSDMKVNAAVARRKCLSDATHARNPRYLIYFFKYQLLYDFFHQKYDLGEELRTSCFWPMNKQTRTHTQMDLIQQQLLLPQIGETFHLKHRDHPGIFHVLCTTRFVMLLEVPVEPLILARDSLYMYICIFFFFKIFTHAHIYQYIYIYIYIYEYV